MLPILSSDLWYHNLEVHQFFKSQKPWKKKQKDAVRIVTLSPYNSHTEPLFKKLNILPLKQLIMYFKIQFM
jgi:hypothetical protein